MNGAFLFYKCRLCGESFSEGHAPSADLALLVAQSKAEMPRTWFGTPPSLVIHHQCRDDSGIGLADLIGAVPDGKENR